jgi:hypothetical protein
MSSCPKKSMVPSELLWQAIEPFDCAMGNVYNRLHCYELRCEIEEARARDSYLSECANLTKDARGPEALELAASLWAMARDHAAQTRRIYPMACLLREDCELLELRAQRIPLLYDEHKGQRARKAIVRELGVDDRERERSPPRRPKLLTGFEEHLACEAAKLRDSDLQLVDKCKQAGHAEDAALLLLGEAIDRRFPSMEMWRSKSIWGPSKLNAKMVESSQRRIEKQFAEAAAYPDWVDDSWIEDLFEEIMFLLGTCKSETSTIAKQFAVAEFYFEEACHISAAVDHWAIARKARHGRESRTE